MNTLLLEIGTEEIPAGYILPALEALAATLSEKLAQARIEHGRSQVYGSPRRLAVKIENVAPKQQSVKSEAIGPPAKIGLDENGRPTVSRSDRASPHGRAVRQLRARADH